MRARARASARQRSLSSVRASTSVLRCARHSPCHIEMPVKVLVEQTQIQIHVTVFSKLTVVGAAADDASAVAGVDSAALAAPALRNILRCANLNSSMRALCLSSLFGPAAPKVLRDFFRAMRPFGGGGAGCLTEWLAAAVPGDGFTSYRPRWEGEGGWCIRN